MTTKENQALQGLLFLLKQSLPDRDVLINEPLPVKIPAKGLVIVRTGDIGEAVITFSPLQYHYQHKAEIEVFTQNPKDENLLSTILQEIGLALSSTTNLNGEVDYMHFEAPEFAQEVVEGAPTIKAASVPVILEYSISNPLA